MRKLFIALGCCGLLFIAGWAFGQQGLGASQWHDMGKLDDLALSMYVRGYTQGFKDGDSAMQKIAAVLTKGTTVDAETKKLLTPQAARMAEIEGIGKNKELTVNKVKDAMTAFYSDYRNAPVCWNVAMQFSLWSLNGDAPTEQEIDSARKLGASGCK